MQKPHLVEQPPRSRQDTHPMTPRHIWSRFSVWMDTYPLRVLSLIVVFALALNIARVWFDPPTYQSGQTDDWWAVVTNLIQGRGYASCAPRYFPFCGPGNQVTASREPAPVLLFTGVALLTQHSLWAAAGVELVINVTVLVAVFALTRQWTNNHAALLATLGWAIYLPALKLVPQVSGDLLAALGVAAGMAFLLRARRTNHTRDWLFAGAGLGLGVMSRSATLVIVAVLVMGLLWERWLMGSVKRWGLIERVRPAALVAVVVATMMTPWLVRNKVALGQPVLGSTLTGYNLYRHNYMLGTDNYLRYVGADEGEVAIKTLVARRPDLRGTENEAQMDAVYRDEALKVIAMYPRRYVLLSIYRFFPLWFNWEIREAYGLRTGEVDYVIMVQQALLILTASVGVLTTGRRSWPLWVSVGVMSLAYMAVNSQLRYLIPVMPLVISLSAAGIMRLAQLLR